MKRFVVGSLWFIAALIVGCVLVAGAVLLALTAIAALV